MFFQKRCTRSYCQRIPYRTWRDWNGWIVPMAWFVRINLAAKSPMEKKRSDFVTHLPTNPEIGFDSSSHGCSKSKTWFQRPLIHADGLIYLDRRSRYNHWSFQSHEVEKKKKKTNKASIYLWLDHSEVFDKDDYIIDIQLKTTVCLIQVLTRLKAFLQIENSYIVVALTVYQRPSRQLHHDFDIDYVVSGTRNLIVDQFTVVPWKVVVNLMACTKRLAKEGVPIQDETNIISIDYSQTFPYV